MEFEARRDGTDRRRLDRESGAERRDGDDRRSLVNNAEKMMSFMKSIPVFHGLTSDQFRKILYICYNKTVPADLFLFEDGDKADGMFILLEGRVRILSHKSTLITELEPITLIGGEEFFTGAHRRTSVVTTSESTIIRINKAELYRVFQGDYSLSNRILLNIITEFAGKLESYTDIIRELRTAGDA